MSLVRFVSAGNCWTEAENDMRSSDAAAQAMYYEWGMCERHLWNMCFGEDNRMGRHDEPVA